MTAPCRGPHRNVRENPYITALVHAPMAWRDWTLELEFDRSETDGPLFDEMDMKLEAIASMSGMSGIFKLRAADVYRVLSAIRLNNRVSA